MMMTTSTYCAINGLEPTHFAAGNISPIVYTCVLVYIRMSLTFSPITHFVPAPLLSTLSTRLTHTHTHTHTHTVDKYKGTSILKGRKQLHEHINHLVGAVKQQ